MNFLSIIASLRKFGNFVVGLFPVLGSLVDYFLNSFAGFLNRDERIKSSLDAAKDKAHQVADLKLVKAATPAVRRFYWKDYAQDRLQLDELPQGALQILRPLFLVTVTLCLLMPFLQVFPAPPVAVETFAGYKGTAPAWSVILWYLAAALGWGCLLAGAALCNRIFFTFAAVIYVTLFGACALYLPQSYCNAIIPLVVFLALAEAEKNRRAPRWQRKPVDAFLAYSMALAAGIPAGVYLLALTPVQPFFKPFVLQSGCVIGAAIAVSTISFQRRDSQLMARLGGLMRLPMPGALSAWLFSLLSATFLSSLLIRGNIGELAGQFISEMGLWNGYLWPVWYFIGIGIIFKLIKNTKVLTKSIKEAVPSKLYSTMVFILLLMGALITWRTPLVAWLTGFSWAGQNTLTPLVVSFYQSTRWYYRDPINSFSAEVLRWLFLFDLVAVFWLLCKRRFNADTASALLYFSALSWFAVTEYMFQWLSFGRSPAHSVFLLMTFSMWLLWLFHTVGLEMSLKSSRSFPAVGRLAIFGSITVFALLEIHSRCAIGDMRVMNEIFLYMFRGIIDVGLPYFLYVFATRRFAVLPLKLSEIFALFVAGAVLSYPLNVIDKFALGGWSAAGLMRIWEAETAALSTTGSINATGLAEPHLSIISIALRSAVFVVSLAFVAWRALIRSRLTLHALENGPGNCGPADEVSAKSEVSGALIFSCLAFASGFASFSKTTVDLPLPDNLRVLVAPFHTSLFFDYYLVALYYAAGIAALLFAFILLASRQNRKTVANEMPGGGGWLLAFVVAFASNFLFMWAWPGKEVWLRSTGILETGTVAGGVLLTLLLIIAVRKIEGRAAELITVRQSLIFAALLFLLLGAKGYTQWRESRLVERNVAACPGFRLPQKWRVAGSAPGTFICAQGSDLSTIAVSRLKIQNSDLKQTLAELILNIQKSKQFIDFKPVKVESWNQYGGGAEGCLAFDFTYLKRLAPGASGEVAMAGTVVLQPDESQPDVAPNNMNKPSANAAVCYCILATPVDMDVRRYDLIRALQARK